MVSYTDRRMEGWPTVPSVGWIWIWEEYRKTIGTCHCRRPSIHLHTLPACLPARPKQQIAVTHGEIRRWLSSFQAVAAAAAANIFNFLPFLFGEWFCKYYLEISTLQCIWQCMVTASVPGWLAGILIKLSSKKLRLWLINRHSMALICPSMSSSSSHGNNINLGFAIGGTLRSDNIELLIEAWLRWN